MSGVARILVVLGLGLVGSCGVAVAGADDESVAIAEDPGDPRVLGKRAFDAAASGYAPFQPLVGESPRRTLARASERIAVLERDLAVMQRHHDPGQADLADELAHATALLTDARLSLATLGRADPLDPARLDAVMALIDEAQVVLHGARQQRIRDAV